VPTRLFVPADHGRDKFQEVFDQFGLLSGFRHLIGCIANLFGSASHGVSAFGHRVRTGSHRIGSTGFSGIAHGFTGFNHAVASGFHFGTGFSHRLSGRGFSCLFAASGKKAKAGNGRQCHNHAHK
jgi:hypothetical protein